MAIKTGKSGKTKPKRSSKGKRKHVRRLKQETRKTVDITHLTHYPPSSGG
jgi:hypothetical protein